MIIHELAGFAVLIGLCGIAGFGYFATFTPTYGETKPGERQIMTDLAIASACIAIIGAIVYHLS